MICDRMWKIPSCEKCTDGYRVVNDEIFAFVVMSRASVVCYYPKGCNL